MEKKQDQTGKVIDQIWEVFSSMKTGLVLLFLLALSAGIGTLTLQKTMYSSFWFELIMGLLGVNLIICTLQRLPGIYRKVFKQQLSAATSSWMQAREIPGPEEELKAAVKAVFNQNGYSLTAGENGGVFCFMARKRSLGNLGSFVTHLSFIVLLAGVLLGSFYGFEGYFMAGTASTVDIRDVPLSKGTISGENFQIRINSAEERVLADGELDNWYSDLSILEEGKEVLRRTIAVNAPLTYRGIVFYQTSFADGAKFTLTHKGNQSTVFLQENGGNYFQVPGEDLFILLGDIQSTAKDEGIAYQVLSNRGTTIQKTGLIKPGQTEEIQSNIQLHCDGLAGFTGIQVKKDPGIPLVWLAFGLLLLGLFLTFYWRTVTIHGLIKPGSARLQMGITSDKRLKETVELDRKVAAIRTSLADGRRKGEER